MFEIHGKTTSAKIFIDDIDEKTLQQIYSFLSHPAFTNPIAIMSDCHLGKGCVIGFTMKITDKIIPNVVGNDIGCSIQTVNIPKFSLSLESLDKQIREKTTFGSALLNKAHYTMKTFPFDKINDLGKKFHLNYQKYFNVTVPYVEYSSKWLEEKFDSINMNHTRFFHSIGTLGSSNHFEETGFSQKSGYWITVHTGSRNFGEKICKHWQNHAKNQFQNDHVEKRKLEIQNIKKNFPQSEIDSEIKKIPLVKVPEDLVWLEGLNAYYYCCDMFFAQFYANLNRTCILNVITKDILKTDIIDSITSTHNFIDFNDFIVRKGAIRSYENERMVIPFNMRDGILICEGKSNPAWNCSSPHGAGRVLSRSQAKITLNLDEFKSSMNDIYSTSVGYSTLDEAPNAYKDAGIIEAAIQDTATILDRIKPIHNMKDSSVSEERD